VSEVRLRVRWTPRCLKTTLCFDINAFTRYVPVIEVRERFSGADVVAALERVCSEVG